MTERKYADAVECLRANGFDEEANDIQRISSVLRGGPTCGRSLAEWGEYFRRGGKLRAVVDYRPEGYKGPYADRDSHLADAIPYLTRAHR